MQRSNQLNKPTDRRDVLSFKRADYHVAIEQRFETRRSLKNLNLSLRNNHPLLGIKCKNSKVCHLVIYFYVVRGNDFVMVPTSQMSV